MAVRLGAQAKKQDPELSLVPRPAQRIQVLEAEVRELK